MVARVSTDRFVLALASLALGACLVTEETGPTTAPAAAPQETSGATTTAPPPAGTDATASVIVQPPEVTGGVAQRPTLPPDPPPPADGRYPIVLDRPAQVGVAVRFEARGEKRSRQRRQLPGGQPTDMTELLVVRMAGVHTVLEIDSTGDAVRSQIEVASCTAEGTGRPEPLVPAGATLVIETAVRPAEGRFLVNGSAVSDRVREHLKILFSASRNPTSDDDVFGSPGRPRRVGERWNVTVAPMVTAFADLFPGLSPGDIRGRTTFHGVAQQAGRTYLDIGVDITMRIRQVANLPPGTRVVRGTMRMRPRGLFSVTPGLPAPRDTMSMDSELDMRIPTPAGQASLQMTITESREFTRVASSE